MIMYFRSTQSGGDSRLMGLLASASVVVYMVSYCAGVGPLMWVFLGEMIPPEYKVLSGLIASSTFVTIFATTQLFPTLLMVLTPWGTYWLFAGVCVLCNVYYFSLMKETKGMSSLEIREMFIKDNSK